MNIPNRLQCAYCIRHYTHGGECSGSPNTDLKGCLVFKADSKGCIRNKDMIIEIPLYDEFPMIDTWSDKWTFNNVDTLIKINKIYGFKWDTKKGYLKVICNCNYYVNEFHEDYIEPNEKPILKIIK